MDTFSSPGISRRQACSWLQASPSMARPSRWMMPVVSAMGMNTSGAMLSPSPSVSRASASKLTSAPVPESNTGW